MTKIMLCGCYGKSAFQDQTYGLNNRLFNRTKGQEGKLYRCSICGNLKGSGLSSEEEKKLSKKGKK